MEIAAAANRHRSSRQVAAGRGSPFRLANTPTEGTDRGFELEAWEEQRLSRYRNRGGGFFEPPDPGQSSNERLILE